MTVGCLGDGACLRRVPMAIRENVGPDPVSQAIEPMFSRQNSGFDYGFRIGVSQPSISEGLASVTEALKLNVDGL